MKDFFAAALAFTGILLIIALGLYLLSRWHQRIERRLRLTAKPLSAFDLAILESKRQSAKLGRMIEAIKRKQRGEKHPTISRADLDVEAAATEAKYYDLPEHIRHRNKFEGRHYDAESVG